MGTGAMAGHCTEDNRSIFLACDYAGNVSVAEIQGGSHMVDEDMDLQASATTLAVGDTITIDLDENGDYTVTVGE